MLAVIYLIFAALLGNLLCRKFFHFVSLPHRLAANFLIGILFSTWATYLFALAFFWTQNPLLWGNLFFFIGSSLIFFWFYKRNLFKFSDILPLRNHDTDNWDWIFTATALVFTCWLMFGMFGLSGGNLKIDSILWNDFGPNLSLVQSFAVGRNFPTEYPHYIGEPIRYHFLYWFQAGNLTFLGLRIDWSLNVLSVLTWTAMLVLIAVLGQTIFKSKAVGRIGAILFFSFGTLAYIPFLLSANSATAAFNSVINLKEWLKSGYTYVGEGSGVWALGTFLAQRHLPTSIGIFLIVLIFLINQIREKLDVAENRHTTAVESETETESAENETENKSGFVSRTSDSSIFSTQNRERKHFNLTFQTYIFCGLLLGLLPLWNSAVYVSAVAVVSGLLLLFPNRLHTFYLLFVSAIVAVPQILFLRAGDSKTVGELFHWGYVVESPTLENVLKYFSFTFGAKTLLALFAAAILSAFHRRLFAAFFILVILAFATKLSADTMNNHKFLHIWMILVNLFVAYTLWRLSKVKIVGKVAAALLFLAIAAGGIFELFRIHNDNVVNVPFSGGRLYEWLETETEPKDVFLTAKHVHHPILLAGRRIFYGWSYFGWSMGYKVGERDAVYKRMFEEKNPAELIRLLDENSIKYVAIDDDLRRGEFGAALNEAVYESLFPKVFIDRERRYGSLVVYRVTAENLGQTAP